MIKTLDMQFIRYMNLFGGVARVSAKHCFSYNNTLVFVVPRRAVQRAIGKDNENLRKLSGIVGKRIRVVPEPIGMKDLQYFVSILVSPVQFDKIEVQKIGEGKEAEAEAVISTPGMESKAMLIGRGRARETELKEILHQYFGIKGLKII